MQEIEAFIDNLPKDEQMIVKRLGIASLSDIDERLLCEVFYEAILVDDQFIKRNK